MPRVGRPSDAAKLLQASAADKKQTRLVFTAAPLGLSRPPAAAPGAAPTESVGSKRKAPDASTVVGSVEWAAKRNRQEGQAAAAASLKAASPARGASPRWADAGALKGGLRLLFNLCLELFFPHRRQWLLRLPGRLQVLQHRYRGGVVRYYRRPHGGQHRRVRSVP